MTKKQKIPLFLLSLIPLAYIIKGALPFDLTLVLYIFLYCIAACRFLFKKEHFRVSKIDIFFFIWLVILIFGVFYSPFQISGLFKSAQFLFLGVSLIFFARIFIKNREDTQKFLKYLLVNSTLTGYLVLFDFILSGQSTVRYQAFGEVVPIPLSLLGAMTILIAIILYYRKKIKFISFSLVLIPSVSVITIAASKGPVVSLGVTLFLISPFLFKKIRVFPIIFLGVSLFLVTRIGFINDSLNNLIYRFSRIEDDMSTSIRLGIMEEAFSSFYSNPFFGEGTAANVDYPHNFFIEILSENGLILFIITALLLSLFGLYYINLILAKKAYIEEIIIVAILICSLVSLMFSFTYVDHKYLFLSTGLLIAFYKIKKDEVKEKQESRNNELQTSQ